eukprot:364841-Chlamydomonas_euryale.AAC.10
MWQGVCFISLSHLTATVMWVGSGAGGVFVVAGKCGNAGAAPLADHTLMLLYGWGRSQGGGGSIARSCGVRRCGPGPTRHSHHRFILHRCGQEIKAAFTPP